MRWYIHALFFLLVLLGAYEAQAQKKFTLSGQITDSIGGKPVKRAIVNVGGTKFTDTTNNDGFYKIPNLIAGTNNLVVYAEGFDTSVTKFYIKANMTVNAKLLVLRDTTPKPLPVDTVKKIQPKPQDPPQGKDKEPKKKKEGIDEKDKEFLGELIEDVIFYNKLYFSSFKEKKATVKAIGYFTVESGVIYEFEALFNKMGEGFALVEFTFEKKGKH